jgi:hypothetical protein
MGLADMALLLKGMKPDTKNNLLFLMTGMELQAAMDKEGSDRKDETTESTNP